MAASETLGAARCAAEPDLGRVAPGREGPSPAIVAPATMRDMPTSLYRLSPRVLPAALVWSRNVSTVTVGPASAANPPRADA